MPVPINEQTFERNIEAALLAQGYRQRSPAAYDRALCMDPDLLLAFVQGTQPQTWAKYTRQYPTGAARRFTERVARHVERQGLLYALRHDFKDSGCHFRLAYFRPNTTLNPAEQERYRGNIFSVVRQLRYRPPADKHQPELDLVLFLNGLPLFTAELKNQFTGQNVQRAIQQYQKDRPPTEPLFALGRCLAHFAVDDQEVWVTPRLAGEETPFLPFNRGHNYGAGNPPADPSSGKYATSYLWDEIWSGDSVLNLIQRFIHQFDEQDEYDNPTGKKSLVFPRYHQLTAVRQLIDHARRHGAGERYLIQHSAGSGKTYTISWLTHQLSVLHDDQDEPIFDKVIVVTDRRVLDRQLRGAVRNFERTLGAVAAVENNSQELLAALESNTPIITTTLQKFPVIARKVSELRGTRFAIVVDEAHSSQSGSTTQAMHRALHAPTLEEAAAADAAAEAEQQDMEDVMVEEMALRHQLSNVSTFAFTATPKAKTLQLFGTPGDDGKPRPFSLYPMRQAIEEGFILDVLAHYTTYTSYWRLLKTIADDPRYDRSRAQRLLKTLVELSPHAIEAKTALIVEHFAYQVAHLLAGRAKAMIVTRSRLHAVRYKLAVDRYIRRHRYPFKTLVAFSGTVEDGGQTYTEAGMNTRSAGRRIPESATKETFEKPEYRLLIVAEKFQTGFDQPLLQAMYVDKKLGGVNAVQTLSRLNRTHAGKPAPIVLDFVNEADAIREAFQPYYEATILSAETDPNVLYQLQAELDETHLYTAEEIDTFIAAYFQGDGRTDQAKLYALFHPVIERLAKISKDERRAFRGRLRDFVRLYAFLAQIVPFTETDWEKRFHFYRLLLKLIYQRFPEDARAALPQEIRNQVDIGSYRVRQTSEGDIALESRVSELKPVGEGAYRGGTVEPEQDPLSVIIEELNTIYDIQTNGDTEAAIRFLQQKLLADMALEAGSKVNSPETFRTLFDDRADEHFGEMVDAFYKFYKKVTANPRAKDHFFDWLFDQYREEQ
jgi:type I restriction enzyme R subunit